MKKIFILAVVALVAVAALGITGLALAQDQVTPTVNNTMREMMNTMRGQGGQGGMHGMGMGQPGVLHDYMHPAMAEALGLTPAELDEQIAAGETFYSLAQAQGLDDEAIQALMLEARTKALDAAVADGVITQDQADQMLARMGTMMQNGAGQGPCHGGTSGPRGPRGGGRQPRP